MAIKLQKEKQGSHTSYFLDHGKGRTEGPLNMADTLLRLQVVNDPNMMVWKEGHDWQEAWRYVEFSGLFQSPPPTEKNNDSKATASALELARQELAQAGNHLGRLGQLGVDHLIQGKGLGDLGRLGVPNLTQVKGLGDAVADDVTAPRPGIFRAPFSFNGRIRRSEYALSVVVAYVSYAGLFFASGGKGFFWGVGAILILYIVLAQGAKRCHDLGNSGWYQCIPFYGFWMLLAEGDKGANIYGLNPK